MPFSENVRDCLTGMMNLEAAHHRQRNRCQLTEHADILVLEIVDDFSHFRAAQCKYLCVIFFVGLN